MKQITIILFMLLGMMFTACSSNGSKGKESGNENAESTSSKVEQTYPQKYTFSGGGVNGGMRYDMKYELTLNSDGTAEIHSTMNGGYPRTIKASWEIWKTQGGMILVTLSDINEIILGRNMKRTNYLYLYDGHVFFDMSAAKAKDYEAGAVLNRK